MSESVPSSTTGFAHRRSRADSTASFTYYPDDEESPEPSTWLEEEAVVDPSDGEYDDDFGSINGDLEVGRTSIRRKSSGFSRISVEDPLLRRQDSAKTDTSEFSHDARNNQKLYIVTEDLTVVFAGFRTSKIGIVVYTWLCLASLGLGYLLLRWMPRWKVRLIGTPATLKSCDWVVVEVKLPSHQTSTQC